MTVRPIIFSTPMVLALLAGRKTQTRRLATSPLAKAEPGDLLYVRENFHATKGFSKPVIGPHAHLFGFDVTGTDREFVVPNIGRVREFASHLGGWGGRSSSNCPSIHLPRWASRLTLAVEHVDAECLQDIDDHDAMSEGVVMGNDGYWTVPHAPIPRGEEYSFYYARTPRETFAKLWQALHGQASWNENQKVAPITFKAHKCNVDQMAKE